MVVENEVLKRSGCGFCLERTAVLVGARRRWFCCGRRKGYLI